ncbi:hypothetical protein [Streptomyces sp. NPDC089919]|uniref:hypothetical protein n=1 Tax=Streptomyces sp. NPDC089919 TaxID=3155188 RepID=UPI00342D7D73
MLSYYEVDVPIRSASGAIGWHVFAGRASCRRDAMLLASHAYHQAVAASQAGLNLPQRGPDGWGARGYRAGWTPDWFAARTRRVHL